eukprot:CAMPEP_0119288706 /NCGR_PEP_ID=MMETSP1329-20130426/37719_1 /TAXON_ID=114041 /ORGANISM="Genus nov. species nov., Strain RCC1024" /LENGTH=286 /DNA_ID=CAMNT_0007289489 /DNA_START=75 /DNA_END=931 /DNA_ORIENTATION=+
MLRWVLVAVVAALAAIPSLVGRTTWWAGYALSNCNGCQPTIDWTQEKAAGVASARAAASTFRADGAVVLSDVLPLNKVAALSRECDALPNTFMTDVIARVILPFYLRYEHKIDTRSELVRDWAVHGPLGAIAAELMGVERVRLYNAELIFHRGATSPTCEPAWHRDTLAAPFEPHNKAVTFNVYLEPIDAEGDGLVYFRGSHLRLDAPPASMDLLEPAVRVGSILAHDPNAYHTTSGRGCWRRRSLQFRYVADGATFSFGPHRLPHGPIPWTFAHAPGVAPHGLSG